MIHILNNVTELTNTEHKKSKFGHIPTQFAFLFLNEILKAKEHLEIEMLDTWTR